jgi:small basic protein
MYGHILSFALFHYIFTVLRNVFITKWQDLMSLCSFIWDRILLIALKYYGVELDIIVYFIYYYFSWLYRPISGLCRFF